MCSTSFSEVGSTRSTLFVPKPLIQTAPAPTATPHGLSPTLTRPVTRFVAGFMRWRVAVPKFVTQMAPKPATTPHGRESVRIVFLTIGP